MKAATLILAALCYGEETPAAQLAAQQVTTTTPPPTTTTTTAPTTATVATTTWALASTTALPSPPPPKKLGVDFAAAKAALNDLWSALVAESREFTTKISPSMKLFSERMTAAGLPAPLVQGFREIRPPPMSLLPEFVPDIPALGPLNVAAWSQEQIDNAFGANGPQVINLFNPNTVAELPGVGRFDFSAETALDALATAAAAIPAAFPIHYQRIPGPAPTYLNLPELGIFNPANAYEAPAVQRHLAAEAAADQRQLGIAADLLQNGVDRINELFGVSNVAGQVLDPVFQLVNQNMPFQALSGNNAKSGGLLNNLLDRSARIAPSLLQGSQE